MSTVETLDRLNADQLQAALRGAIIGREIIVLEQTGSTNDAIWRVAPISEGLVVFAEHQTDGRGQRGNRWESAARKGLWFSILLRPEIRLSESGRLTIWAIEAISDVVRTEVGLKPAIKLPNDVQINGRKVAGVLVEMRAQNNAPHVAVVGIGINVNQCRDNFPTELQDNATSLAMAVGRQVARQKLALALLQNLDVTYREKFACSEGGDLGSRIAHTTLGRSTSAATASLARTTTRDTRAAKSQRV
jgi:BirA family transcriptional regulator, biotin operon repressor / biotin---[acetyl-CoA-carboxylase] ligase